MVTFFFDWEIRDQHNVVVKWCNTLWESDDCKSPITVFGEARASVYADMKLPATYSVRAVTFHKI